MIIFLAKADTAQLLIRINVLQIFIDTQAAVHIDLSVGGMALEVLHHFMIHHIMVVGLQDNYLIIFEIIGTKVVDMRRR